MLPAVDGLYPAALYLHRPGERVQSHIEELLGLVGKGQRLVDIPDGGKNALAANVVLTSGIISGQ